MVGLDIFATERCWEAALPATFDILRDRRLGLVALAGPMPQFGMPLAKPWASHSGACGAGTATGSRSIAIGGYYSEPLGEIAEEIAFYKELGLAGIKLKVGGASPEEDALRGRRAQDKRRAMTS